MDFGILLEIKADHSFDYEEMQTKVIDYCEDNDLKSFLTLDFECQVFIDEENNTSGLILMRYNYFDEPDEDLEETREFVYENEEENVELIADFIRGMDGVSTVSIALEEL